LQLDLEVDEELLLGLALVLQQQLERVQLLLMVLLDVL